MCVFGVEKSVLAIHWLIKLAISRTFMKERERQDWKGKLCLDCDRPWFGAEEHSSSARAKNGGRS